MGIWGIKVKSKTYHGIEVQFTVNWRVSQLAKGLKSLLTRTSHTDVVMSWLNKAADDDVNHLGFCPYL